MTLKNEHMKMRWTISDEQSLSTGSLNGATDDSEDFCAHLAALEQLRPVGGEGLCSAAQERVREPRPPGVGWLHGD